MVGSGGASTVSVILYYQKKKKKKKTKTRKKMENQKQRPVMKTLLNFDSAGLVLLFSLFSCMHLKIS